MYLYTPKKSIIRSMQVAKTGNWWDKEFWAKMSILKQYHLPQTYELGTVLKRDFHKVRFYSRESLFKVPVRGYLFPAEMFDEIEV